VSKLVIPYFLRWVRAHTGVNECHQHLQTCKHNLGHIVHAYMTGQAKKMSVDDVVPHLVLIIMGEW